MDEKQSTPTTPVGSTPASTPTPTPATTPEDAMSYATEKYPGKLCCMCNLGERSALGQGDFLSLKVVDDAESQEETASKCNSKDKADAESDKSDAGNSSMEVDKSQTLEIRRPKSNCGSKGKVNECLNELSRIGQPEPLSLSSLIDGAGHFYVHRMCAMWAAGTNANLNEVQMVQLAASKCLQRKCTYCGQYGASVDCRMSCTKAYHLPCAMAAGCFLVIRNLTAFCAEHLYQVPYVCTDTNIDCRDCSSLGDIAKLLMCATCGDHYHTTCIGLPNLPDTRTGWNCVQCSKCQVCRQSDVTTDGRSIKCEHCQKLYHATCLRPVMASIPKYGWKCNRCRVCTDCGSRTPGAGSSSRWHCHYTICDSCYQQRNKGFSCPICHKAYRAAAHKEMVKCSWCNRFVHSTCDEEADLTIYHKKKEHNPDYDYYCPRCKTHPHPAGMIGGSAAAVVLNEGANGALMMVNERTAREMAIGQQYLDKGVMVDGKGADGKMLETLKVSKKRLGLKFVQRCRSGKIMVQKMGASTPYGRKRGGRGRSRHSLFNNDGTYGLPCPGGSSGHAGRALSRGGGMVGAGDDDYNMDKKLVLFSAKDTYLLLQDLCVMCGSIGMDQDGCLIACTQCGQCYHPYCASIKISLVVLKKGWRCLDCTICEGCGQKDDEARLILCDECDISFHTYCMQPPLDTVPNGNWKCKWCAVCQKCGRNTPGKNSSWRNGFLECGPCASQRCCCVCQQAYGDAELMLQCGNCERWLHGRCDSIQTEKEAQQCVQQGNYQCVLCRPKNKTLEHGAAGKSSTKGGSANKDSGSGSHAGRGCHDELGDSLDASNSTSLGPDALESTHWLDGVCVTNRGLNVVKALSTEIKKRRKLRPVNEAPVKTAGITATIESVVAGGTGKPAGDDECAADDEVAQHSKKQPENYKDGMVWASQEGSPPLGFAIATNEDGVNVLRKKRQRNLQKLGIGGFSVRNRGLKKDCEDHNGSTMEAYLDLEKRKKVARKKSKTKLFETYPAHLQEAFFGTTLLSNRSAPAALGDSDSSDEFPQCNMESPFPKPSKDTTNAAADDKAVIPSQFNLEMETKLHLGKIKTEIEEMHLPTGGSNSVTPQEELKPLAESTATPSTKAMAFNPSEALVNAANAPMWSGAAIKTEPQQQMPTYLVKEHKQLTPHAADNFPLLDIPPTIKLGTASQTQIGLGMALKTETSRYTTLGQQQLTSNSGMLQSTGSVPLIMAQQATVPPQELQQTASMQMPMQDMLYANNKKPQGRVLMQLQQQQITTPQVAEDQTLSLLQPTRTIAVAAPAVDVPKEPADQMVVGSQKTAEKMHRDEDLGAMSTISAVLYANLQHPELKGIYPNWNDRCKQIIKIWRSLSTEKKAPFLQNAKDNRSALRMRKAQQEQEKTCYQQKTLRENEQERIWRQHQAKAKEATLVTTPPNMLTDSMPVGPPRADGVSYGNMDLMISGTAAASIGTAPSIFPVTHQQANILQPPTMQRNTSYLESTPSRPVKSSKNARGEKTADSKQLRNLLLKQELGHLTSAPPNTLSTPAGGATHIFLQQQSTSQNDNELKQMSEMKMSTSTTMLVETKKLNIKMGTANSNPIIGNQNAQLQESVERAPIEAEVPSGSSVLRKLDAEEAGGFGDILSGFGEDDDDLLKSLTAEMGDDFNILEYADPELDEIGQNQLLLHNVDFVDSYKNN